MIIKGKEQYFSIGATHGKIALTVLIQTNTDNVELCKLSRRTIARHLGHPGSFSIFFCSFLQ